MRHILLLTEDSPYGFTNLILVATNEGALMPLGKSVELTNTKFEDLNRGTSTGGPCGRSSTSSSGRREPTSTG